MVEFALAFGQALVALVALPLGRFTDDPIVALHPGKHGGEPVILLLRDRIELVIVATRAIYRHRDRGPHHLGDHIIEIEGTGGTTQFLAPRLDLTDKIPRTGREEAGRDDRVRLLRPERVSRDLLLQEAEVGLVGVEALDDIVAISPGMVAALVALEAMGVGIVRKIEPVPGEALPKMRRREETIDQLPIGIGSLILHEGLDRLRRRGQPMQVEGEPPNQRGPIGFGRGGKADLGAFRLDEGVDRMPLPP